MVGVSSDSVDSHCSFADHEELPFPILSDPGELIRKAYGVMPSLFGLVPGRVTFVIDRDGSVVHVYRSMLGFRKHVREALDAVAALRQR